jgi:hypothetical protein
MDDDWIGFVVILCAWVVVVMIIYGVSEQEYLEQNELLTKVCTSIGYDTYDVVDGVDMCIREDGASRVADPLWEILEESE